MPAHREPTWDERDELSQLAFKALAVIDGPESVLGEAVTAELCRSALSAPTATYRLACARTLSSLADFAVTRATAFAYSEGVDAGATFFDLVGAVVDAGLATHDDSSRPDAIVIDVEQERVKRGPR